MKLFKINSRSAAPRAFTLIEIALCLGIIGFALVAIIAVLPRGLDVQKRNREETIIGHDADVWMSAIRSGARGFDDLTNYVLCITNSWTKYNADYSIADSGVDYYTPSNSMRTSLIPATDDFPLTNGAHIIGLLSTPKTVPAFIPPATQPFQSNYVVCYVRAFSGSAVDKAPQKNGTILGDAFTYRMIVENFPYSPVNTNEICMDCAAALATNGMSSGEIRDWWVNRTNLLKAQWLLLANAHDLRLKFRWPVLPNGKILDYSATFRTMTDGIMWQTNDPAANPQPLYFVQASTFVTNSPP
jgi:type II secretory pathway pseudopilin PulG